MQNNLSTANQLIVVLYFLLLFLVVLIKPKSSTSLNYILAGRKLTLFPFVATLVTTTYGWILGTGQLYYEYGYFAWFFLNLPYAIFSLVFAFFLSKKLRKQKFTTLPDLLQKHYGKPMANITSVLILIFTSPAMYVLMAAQVVSYIWPIPMWVSIFCASVFSVIYILRGGFDTVVKTDMLQFVFMFGGFLVVFLNLFFTYGFEPILNTHKNFNNTTSSNSLWYVIGWFVFATITLVDPNYHQRINAVDKPKTAKIGLIISVICWTIFDFFSATVALYALWLEPNLQNHSHVYLFVGSTQLPGILPGIFMVAILATIFSTANSFFFTSALNISKDLLHRNNLFLKIPIIKLTNYTLLMLAVITFIMVLPYQHSTVIELFFDFTPYVVCGILLPVLSSYYTKIKMPAKHVLVQTILAVFTNAFARFLDTNINEVFWGLLAAVLYQLGYWLILYFSKNRVKNLMQ